ncbi:MAG TPA: YCF48-related protein, partial [Candidatus Angelobacter sp.]|nr:YCF48-related protein [Candidatus Angelobacter sp.]
MRPAIRTIPVLISLLLASAALAGGQSWQPVGPDGGTVRSLAIDPRDPDKIFLGTSAGNLYLSSDNGASWSRFARPGNSAEMVLDHIVIDPTDPRRMFVAAWNAQLPNSDGDLFRSKDGGKSWEIVADLHGKSLRALSIAAANPKILVVGALDGIYRSRDGGGAWERISPEGHAELKNVESIAIDPANADVIYAGTWHLPWKTEDGGKTWRNIKKGVIDDSDVFSIVIDASQPSNLFISACSGIYRSESAGELFRKMQGIPYSARRTRMLQMDPADHNVVYAGTTEGLWKTTDAGATWKHMTGSNIIINDVL